MIQESKQMTQYHCHFCGIDNAPAACSEKDLRRLKDRDTKIAINLAGWFGFLVGMFVGYAIAVS